MVSLYDDTFNDDVDADNVQLKPNLRSRHLNRLVKQMLQVQRKGLEQRPNK